MEEVVHPPQGPPPPTRAANRLATVIPVFRSVLTSREDQRVAETIRNSSVEHVYFVGPRTLDTGALSERWPAVEFVPFDADAFTSVMAYSDWMLRPDLYRRFLGYEYVLIAQTDAFLIKPLPGDAVWRFDYLGSPWEPPWVKRWDEAEHRLRGAKRFRGRRLRVGNGGLSLRRTSAFAQKLNLPDPLVRTSEDIAISYFHSRIGIRLASARTARRFFMEMGASAWSPGDPVPSVYGFHALDKFNPSLESHLLDGEGSCEVDPSR